MLNLAFPILVLNSWHHLKLIACVLAVLALSVGVLYLVVKALLRQSLPKFEGELNVEGLRKPVTIDRDSFGVPSIQAESLTDALFAQGFVQAQDRLWQMELNRRVGAGSLSELFGEQALQADIFLRRLGLESAARSDLEAMDQGEKELLEAFCDGVNAGIESLKVLPAEFRLLRFQPEKWEALHSLTWIQAMSMDLCANWEQELLRGRLLQAVGPESCELLHLFTQGATLTVPPQGKGPEVLKGLSDLYAQAKRFLPNGGLPGGSNAWVISGKRTSWGSPILANDPHLAGRMPSIWYETHLKTPDLEVRGASFAGFPFVVIGSNRQVAWGITNSYADTQDLYLERFRAGNTGEYETENGFQPLETWEESFQVKGKARRTEMMEASRHGTILFRNDEYGLALKWMNSEPSHPIRTLLRMNRASSSSEFKEALRGWQAPSSNFVFADTNGDIGYLMAGHLPKRKEGTGLTPVPGWSGEFEWEGTLAFEDLPQVDNPDCGYIVTANNPVVGPEFPHHITWDWMNSARAQRIEEKLLGHSAWTISCCRELQLDIFCSTGLRFVEACQSIELDNPSAQSVLNRLRMWDGFCGAESREALLFEVSFLTLAELVLKKTVGQELAAQILGQSENPVSIMAGHTGRYTIWLVQLMEDQERYQKLRELHPELPELESLLELAFLKAHVVSQGRKGKTWGQLHGIQFRHPLAINGLLGHFLNGPFRPIGGDTDTVMQTAMNPQNPYSSEAWCPSFRQVVELDPKGISYHSVIPTGQSGHPGSANYNDQFDLWYRGETRSPDVKTKWTLKLSPKT